MTKVVTVYAIMWVISFFAFFVCSSKAQNYKDYLIPAGENELRFQKPVWVPISAIFLFVSFTCGGLIAVATSQPEPPSENELGLCFFMFAGLFIASFLGPESLTIDLTGQRYTRYRSWFHLKSSGPLSDFSQVNVLTSNGRNSTTYFCKLEWHGGSSMSIGRFGRLKRAEDLAQQMSTTLNVPIINEQQRIN